MMIDMYGSLLCHYSLEPAPGLPASDPMGMMHQFSMHQQAIPQNLQPSTVEVLQPSFWQFHFVYAIVPPQHLIAPQQHH